MKGAWHSTLLEENTVPYLHILPTNILPLLHWSRKCTMWHLNTTTPFSSYKCEAPESINIIHKQIRKVGVRGERVNCFFLPLIFLSNYLVTNEPHQIFFSSIIMFKGIRLLITESRFPLFLMFYFSFCLSHSLLLTESYPQPWKKSHSELHSHCQKCQGEKKPSWLTTSVGILWLKIFRMLCCK